MLLTCGPWGNVVRWIPPLIVTEDQISQALGIFIEEREGRLIGYETKWSVRKRVRPPGLWVNTYPNAEYQVITPDNYLEFIT